ncbi:anti-sigma factor domain-containing protein [Brachybacterium tyrofermentans]|uniref:anti-sigma factor domain-containing protein n=1 Tax=Brachybacterium tyrofermentans TaxID=47848 RepID=UPI003FD0CDA0
MNEQKRDMTGAWALNALDADERARIEDFLAQDPDAAAEARSFEETAGELARGLEPEAPRPELKSSLMARIAQTPQLSTVDQDSSEEDRSAPRAATHRRADVPPADAETETAATSRNTTGPESDAGSDAADAGHDATVIPLDRYRSSVRRSRWLAVAAAALMVTTVAGVGLWSSERAAEDDARSTIEALESEQAASDEEREMISALMSADDTSQITVTPESGGDLHVMYSRDQKAMIVQAAGLPELPSDSTYQLWIVDDTATSAGLISKPDQTVMAREEMSPTAQIGLSIEPAGGSEEPTDVIAIKEL